MTGDIGYSDQRFSKALRLLALNEGSYRERLKEAISEAVHATGYDNPRPIPEGLRRRMDEFFERCLGPIDDMTDEEANEVGEELIALAEDIHEANQEGRSISPRD